MDQYIWGASETVLSVFWGRSERKGHMLFNSLQFIIFFCITALLYYIFPYKLRWVLLLAASYGFYMAWRPELIVLIVFSSFVNYAGAYAIEKGAGKKALIPALVIDILLLFIFKYLVFISNSFKWLYELLGREYPIGEFSVILPMGISFYTFQGMGYLIDIYRKEYKAEKNFFKFSLFITFFPQLVAGPIERADRLMGQLFKKHEFDTDNISMGIKYMLIGYFKKVVIADRAAVLVDTVYNSPHDFGGLALIIATVFFAFRIYGDFSGYSDIAKGCAKVLGIDLMQNFNRPYFASSIKDFWRRWHISLSTWFKDYLYIPLGGSRCSKLRRDLNLLITFCVSGLWHGANWTFVLWGFLHGIYQVAENHIFRSNKDAKPNKVLLALTLPFRWAATFVLVVLTWIPFRSNTISDCVYIFKSLPSDIGRITDMQYLYETVNSLGLGIFEIGIVAAAIIVLLLAELISIGFEDINVMMKKLPFVVRFGFYYCIAAIIISCGVFSGLGEFIYFQF